MATKAAVTYRPEQLAEKLGIPGKRVRAYLRQEFPRAADEKNTSWVLSAAQAKKVLQHFSAKPAQKEEEEA